MAGFEKYTTETLTIIHENLSHGLQLVGQHYANGTADIAPSEKEVPPSQAGTVTLMLYFRVAQELDKRRNGE